MILEGPNILTVVLKRFQVRVFILVSLMVSTIVGFTKKNYLLFMQSDNFEKLSKPIHFPELLDISPYLSDPNHGDHPVYSLYAVVVHLDAMSTSFSGHYVCYIKTLHGDWFKIDDSNVSLNISLYYYTNDAIYFFSILDFDSEFTGFPCSIRDCITRRSIHASLCKVITKSGHIKNPNLVHLILISDKILFFDRDSPRPVSKNGGRKSKERRNLAAIPSRHGNNNKKQKDSDKSLLPRVDSSSGSLSSMFSSSDTTSSCSTKDSTGIENLSDYLFGGVEPVWKRDRHDSSAQTFY